MATSAKELLTNTIVKSIIKDKEFLVTIQGNESVGSALALLSQHKVSSLPVLNENSVSYGSFVDTVDICTFVMRENAEKGTDAVENAFYTTPCSEAANKSRKNPFYQVLNSDNMKSCIGKMVALSNIHRLPVFDLQGTFVGVVSQSQMIGIISDNLSLFPIANKTVGDLRLGLKKVLTVQVSDCMEDAFKLISDHGVSGVAVVDDNSQSLRGNISASDIKLIDSKNGGSFGKLKSPIKEVLGETMAKKKPISVTTGTTIAEVFKLLSNEKIHRAFVVKDRSTELVGVISLVDLLDLILHYV